MAIVKGGVWTNVEDEILKAAVSKYGKNQWARISSLLVRKAPKQCKARWYEWLDPGIKKVEWTRDEDEKLLHLAKLLPTQWRTIAPIVGRTSTQCLERYQKLLDDAEAAEHNELGLSGPGAEGSAPTADTVRKLRPGETDPDPETKPAKPDAIDMDEDEKEMLSEARARLANTQGKKAKRKQREKLLEETKRLSVIQKRRDLKAAGINIKLNHRKKGEMDYNADIPFEHKPALGFYDTSEEAQANEKERKAVNFRHVEQKRRDEAAASDERKAQNKRGNDTSTESTTQAGSLEKLRKAEQLTKRRKLNLPGPQVSDRELEEIVKIGLSSSEARDLADTGAEYAASRGLLGDYDTIATNQPARTPRTPAAQDNINLEARNLRALTSTQSSLLGAENTPLHGGQQGTGYNGATPRTSMAATPNPLQRPGSVHSNLQETRPGATPLRTPHRDSLSLNASAPFVDADAMELLDTRNEERDAKQKMMQLRSQFASLPTPKNDFELELPEEDGDEGVDMSNDVIEDSAERDERIRRARAEQQAIEEKKRSLVLQRNLPRPKHLRVEQLMQPIDHLTGAERLIAEEMAKLIVSDAVKYPVPGGTVSGTGAVVPDIDLEIMTSVRAQVLQEAGMLPSLEHGISNDPAETRNMIPGMEIYMDDEESELLQLETLLPLMNGKLQEEASKSAKLEKKMSLVLGGYQNRAKVLSAKIREAGSALQQSYIELGTFGALQELEESAITTRTAVLAEEVERLERISVAGQDQYRHLFSQKEELLASMMT